MKFKAIGLVVALGLSLSGCSGTPGTTAEEVLVAEAMASDDFRTCQDARKIRNDALHYGVMTSLELSKELGTLAKRENLTFQMRQALMADGTLFQESTDGFTTNVRDADNFNKYCVGMFGGWEAD